MTLLTATVAHDYNNLLTVIQGNLECVLQDGDHLTGEQKTFLEDALRACVSGAGLSRNLLGLARKQSLAKKNILLKELVMDVVGFCSSSFGESYEFIVDEELVAEDPVILGCYTSLTHALLNIFKNAKDAMSKGGRVFVQVSVTDGFVHLFLIDEGVGMPEHVIEKAGDAYFSTKAKEGKGTGLGLAMVKAVMQQHDGILTIRSTPGNGSTIILSWPEVHDESLKKTDLEDSDLGVEQSKDQRNRAKRSTTAVGKPKVRKTQKVEFSLDRLQEHQNGKEVGSAGLSTDSIDLSSGLTIVVDDNPFVCRTTARVVRRATGMEVSESCSPLEVLEVLKPENPPRWLLVDYEMSEMDGVEFINQAHQILGEGAPTYFVLVTGHPPDYFDSVALADVQAPIFLLTKPFSNGAIQRLVSTTDIKPGLNILIHGQGMPEEMARSETYFAKFGE